MTCLNPNTIEEGKVSIHTGVLSAPTSAIAPTPAPAPAPVSAPAPAPTLAPAPALAPAPEFLKMVMRHQKLRKKIETIL